MTNSDGASARLPNSAGRPWVHLRPSYHKPFAFTLRNSKAIATASTAVFSGQVDLREGRPNNPGDAGLQTRNSVRSGLRMLSELNRPDLSASRIVVFHCGSTPDDNVREAVAMELGNPRAVVTLVRLPTLTYAGMVSEVDVHANAIVQHGTHRQDEATTAWVHDGVVANVTETHRSGATKVSPPGELHGFFAAHARVWYDPAEFARPADALAQAATVPLDGAAVSMFPIEGPGGGVLQTELTLVREAPRTWTLAQDRSGRFANGVKAVRTDAMVFLASHVARPEPPDLDGQTHQVMSSVRNTLTELGLGYEDMIKISAYYRGSAQELESCVRIRSGFYPDPGPTGTGVPVPALPKGARIAIDGFGVLARDGSTA